MKSLSQTLALFLQVSPNPALQQEKINTVFDHVPLHEVLRVIAETLQVKVIQTPDKIVLK
ncbi:MAG: hypothetical protein LRY55_09505 [Leadbetterella sp.]|nr:hypothetical protein [Leadbetterella sp.]